LSGKRSSAKQEKRGQPKEDDRGGNNFYSRERKRKGVTYPRGGGGKIRGAEKGMALLDGEQL